MKSDVTTLQSVKYFNNIRYAKSRLFDYIVCEIKFLNSIGNIHSI